MYNIAICEDEINHLNILLKYFERYQSTNNVDLNINTFDCAEDLLKSSLDSYDIIILDINLKEISGMDASKIIRKHNENCKIVFISAFDKYAVEGYKVNAHRYLVKPISEEDFNESISSIITSLKPDDVFVEISDGSTVKKINIFDIYYIEIQNRKTALHTRDSVLISKISMSTWKNSLCKYNFSSSHNSFLINMKHIHSIQKEEVVLTNDVVIPMSKRKSKEFKDDFTMFIGSIF